VTNGARPDSSAPSLVRARIELIAAAVLWSLSSIFIRLLSEPTPLGLHEPKLEPLQIAFYRSLFAGMALIVLLKRTDVRVRPIMLAMVVCFAIMSGLYLSALSLGPAANAILLQNTAPVWICLFAWAFLGERTDRKTWVSVSIAMIGGAIIVVGNGLGKDAADPKILLMAAGSGVAYAGVILFLRFLRGESAAWLTMLNLVGSALCLAAYVGLRDGWTSLLEWLMAPTASQLAFLAAFGVLQMALPYCLFARGLRTVGPQEAGIITLLEPLLNPLWAFLIAPARDTPTVWTVIGGFVLLTAIAMRYWRPYRPRTK
jgi:DME family drug/metabolite transporter